MSEPLSEEYLAEVQARCDAAHEGPWHVDNDSPDLNRWVTDATELLEINFGYRGNSNQAEAAFVACARQDVPALLAEIRRLRDQNAVLSFNFEHPVGTPVTVYPGCRPEQHPKARSIATRTRTAAWLANGTTPVVMVEDYGSWIALTHVDVTTGGGQ